jgi:branched-chain amino acid transport system permease protein
LFLQLAFGGLALGSLYALSAVGLVVIHKATRSVNFVQGGFIMLGAYAAWLLGPRFGWPAWAVYLAGPVLVGLFAAALEAGILRRLRHADPFAAIIATIFLGLALVEAVRLFFGADMLAVQSPVSAYEAFDVGPLYVTPDTLWTAAGTLIVTLAAIALFSYARIGIGMRSMAASARGAQLCGFFVDRVFAQAWFVGGVLAGLAGLFTAPVLGVSPELAIGMLIPAFVAAVLGGLDSLVGSVVGGLLLGLIETFAGAYGSGAVQGALSFIILVVVLLVRPDGLFASGKVRNV